MFLHFVEKSAMVYFELKYMIFRNIKTMLLEKVQLSPEFIKAKNASLFFLLFFLVFFYSLPIYVFSARLAEAIITSTHNILYILPQIISS
jgi:hypothetical protein